MIEITELGKHTTLEIKFGSGDIVIAGANDLVTGEGFVCFFETDQPQVVGSDVDILGKSVDEVDSIPLTFSFSNPQSIDALIAVLKAVKKKMPASKKQTHG